MNAKYHWVIKLIFFHIDHLFFPILDLWKIDKHNKLLKTTTQKNNWVKKISTTRSCLIIAPSWKQGTKIFQKKCFFPNFIFFQKIFENVFWKKLKKCFFDPTKYLCCPQKVTEFCSKKKREKTFFLYKIFFENVLKTKHCFVFHET